MFRRELVFRILKIGGDVFFINLSFIISFLIRYLGSIPSKNFEAYIDVAPYISILSIILIQLYGLYDNQLKKNITDIFYSFIPISFITVVFTTVLSYFIYAFAFPRTVLIITLPIMITFMMLWRYSMLLIEKAVSKPDDLVIIGNVKEIEKVINNLLKSTNGGYNIKGIIIKDDQNILESNLLNDVKVCTSFKNLQSSLLEMDPDVVLIAHGISEKYKKQILYISLDQRWQVSIIPDFYEILLSGASLEHIGELPVFEMKVEEKCDEVIIKRIFDFIIALVCIVITAPVMIIVSILIKLTSSGPIIYSQERISKNGRTFKVHKFRTMVDEAENRTGPVLASENDNRITPIGKFLRKTRIDELPQLYNVLKGEMSFIGPRPERPFFVNQFEEKIPDYKYRHQIKSGITGLAQVYGYYSTDPEDKLRMDLLYAYKKSTLVDIKILLQTIKVIFIKDKAN